MVFGCASVSVYVFVCACMSVCASVRVCLHICLCVCVRIYIFCVRTHSNMYDLRHSPFYHIQSACRWGRHLCLYVRSYSTGIHIYRTNMFQQSNIYSRKYMLEHLLLHAQRACRWDRFVCLYIRAYSTWTYLSNNQTYARTPFSACIKCMQVRSMCMPVYSSTGISIGQSNIHTRKHTWEHILVHA